MYSQSLLSEIKKKLTLSEIIGKSVLLRRKGHEYHGLCPFHDERTPSFTVNNAKEFYHCFGCGQHGSVFDFLMHQNHMTFKEAVVEGAKMAGVSLPVFKETSSEEEKQHPLLIKILEAASQFFEYQLFVNTEKEALDYLTRKRGLSLDTIKKFRLGFAGDKKDGLKDHLTQQGFSLEHLKTAGLLSEWDDKSWHDKFRNRIIYPILDKKGNVIAFGGRLLGQGTPKYLNSPETPLFQKGHVLYNWMHAQKSRDKKDPLLVVEGYMDVISLTQHGYDRVVAPLGTALTEDQIQALWKLCPEPILCFDGDEAGQRAAKRAAERALPFLTAGHSLSFINLPMDEDPDTFIKTRGLDEWRALLPKAAPLVSILWETEVNQYDRKTPEERALLEKTLEGFCNQIEDPKIKSYYRQEFKNRLFFWNTSKKAKPSQDTRRSPKKIDALQMQERILLATILLHPHLWDTISEEFMFMKLQLPLHRGLQKNIETYFLEDTPLEKEGLNTYLIKCGYENDLKTFLDQDLFMHAPFLKAQGAQSILDAWHQIRQVHSQKLSEKEEIDHAKMQLSATLSPEDWERYKRLKESFRAKDDPEFS